MSVAPPLPVRRKVPAIPSRNASTQSDPQDEEPSISEKPLGGIAARIAALKLDQVGRSPGSAAPNGRPPIPKRLSQTSNSDAISEEKSHQAPNGNLQKKASPPMPPRKSSNVSESIPPTTEHQAAMLPLRRPPPLPQRRSLGQNLPKAGVDNVDDNRRESRLSNAVGERTAPNETVPPLPARRAVPPPLPVRRQSRTTKPEPEPEPESTSEQDHSQPQSEQEGTTNSRTLPPEPTKRRLPPMPPPGRKSFTTVPVTTPKEEPNVIEATYKPPSINRATRPPPISHSTKPTSIVGSARVPTPEPEPEPEPVYEPQTADHHASLFPREQVRTIADLAYDLTSPFESATDKARVIFAWMHHNIAYDAESFLTNNLKHSTPEDTLRSGMAVCAGYSGLYTAIAELAGLQVLTLNGHGKGYGYTATEGGTAPPFNMNHAWNAVVFDDNQWHLIDSTWGSGYLDNAGVYNKRFAPSWFTMTNEEFGVRHFPEEEGYQLRSDGQTVSWESYILAPDAPTEMGDFRKMGYDTNSMLPQEKVLGRGQWVTFHLEKVCWHLERKMWWNDYVLFVTTGGNERVVLDRDERGPGFGWTVQVWIPSDSTQVMIYSVATVEGKDAKGMMPEDVKKVMGRKAMSFSGVAMWKVE